ncbi:MAG: capsule assembly Wzi family protein, partial [Acidobacteriaceae bacterium]|nr:capsule assembly Wzi family protein [Acidobacteriaceae bacterium]
FSDNATPMYALRIRQAAPLLLPGPFRLLGRIRTEFVLGRLSGHHFPPAPWINAQKITLQLTQDFEVGFTRSAIFGGVGHGFTTGNFIASLLSFSSTNTVFSGADPGDRRSGFDFRWRVPKLKRYLTIYSDSLADDEPNPLANPKRSAWGPGVYITALPRLPNVDFRFETYSTWLYRRDEGGKFIYWNDEYHDAYTNDGLVLGSWVGRDARAYVASTTYWSSATDTLTASYHQTKTGSNFLPGGGTQTDISLSAQRHLGLNLVGTASIRGERYFVPVLGEAKRDVAVSVGVVYRPQTWGIRR